MVSDSTARLHRITKLPTLRILFLRSEVLLWEPNLARSSLRLTKRRQFGQNRLFVRRRNGSRNVVADPDEHFFGSRSHAQSCLNLIKTSLGETCDVQDEHPVKHVCGIRDGPSKAVEPTPSLTFLSRTTCSRCSRDHSFEQQNKRTFLDEEQEKSNKQLCRALSLIRAEQTTAPQAKTTQGTHFTEEKCKDD